MKFHPKPSNEFPEFIETYLKRCQAVCPKILVSAGKWQSEDLIPGLSDFDTRFLVSNTTTAEDWLHMSLAVSRVHTQLAEERPHWARILEHLPGVNLSLSEILDPVFYYPEFGQWTFYHGDSEAIRMARLFLSQRRWSRRDELFHLKKFAIYFGSYQRGIDPAVNLGLYENKYPLHSRLMHYFTPPVQSAVSLMHRRNYCGKLEALRIARSAFPNPEVIDLVLDAVERHYEVPAYYSEPALSELERTLEKYLLGAYASLQETITLIEARPEDTPQQMRTKLASVTDEPAESFFEGVRYCRFMKGRLIFYATPIPWFETTWLIRNELGRMTRYFYTQPLTIYGAVRYRKRMAPETVLDALSGEILSAEESSGMRRFSQVASLPVPQGEERQYAQRVAALLDPVILCLEKLKTDLRPCIGAANALPGLEGFGQNNNMMIVDV